MFYNQHVTYIVWHTNKFVKAIHALLVHGVVFAILIPGGCGAPLSAFCDDAQGFSGASGMICNNGCGETEICPVNGRSCAAISSAEADTPVANSPSATSAASRSSQWSTAIASNTHAACR